MAGYAFFGNLHQPMGSADGTLWIVFNSGGDTEVPLQADPVWRFLDQ